MKELERVDTTLTSYNPATGEALGQVPLMGPDEVGSAVASARSASAAKKPIMPPWPWPPP